MQSGLLGVLVSIGKITRKIFSGSSGYLASIFSLLLTGSKRDENVYEEYKDDSKYLFWTTGAISFFITVFWFISEGVYRLDITTILSFILAWMFFGFFTFLVVGLLSFLGSAVK